MNVNSVTLPGSHWGALVQLGSDLLTLVVGDSTDSEAGCQVLDLEEMNVTLCASVSPPSKWK